MSFTSPAWLEDALTGPCTFIGLPQLAKVGHFLLAGFVGSVLLQQLSHSICPRLFPVHYPTLTAKQHDWDLHVVGWAYSIIATPLALFFILNPSAALVKDPLYGFALGETRLAAFATGYFIWDFSVSLQHIKTQGIGFVLHGGGCAIAFLFTMKPFLLYCAPNFLIWELSTIFLNVHWYLDKFNMTGSTYQLVNGFFLLSAYIGARLIWGTYQSYGVLSLLFGPNSDPSIYSVRWIYGFINLMLNGLNFFWFRAMILALRKRFVKVEAGSKKEAIEVDGKLNWKRGTKQAKEQ